MSETTPNLDALLDRLAAGELDAFEPDEIEALERHLNEHSGAAERMINVKPPAAGELAFDEPMPDESAWGAVWDGIDAGVKSARRSTIRRSRWSNLFRVSGALAACALAMVAWKITRPDASAGWSMELAGNVEIEDLEVFGDETGFVSYADDDSGAAFVWVMEDAEGA